MPLYLPSFQGITQSEALAEAAAYAPINRAVLYAYELWHPSISTPIRLVNNNEDALATLESDAPRNPSAQVLFRRCRVQVTRPEEGAGAASPQITMRIDNVTGFVADALRSARDAAASVRDTPWQLIERVYASDDLSAPHRLPVFKVTPIRVTIGGPVAIITAIAKRSGGISIPSATFTPESYPGLLT